MEDKKLIAFDVDGTLTESRSRMDAEMAILFSKLLTIKKVAIVTGETFADIKLQILDQLNLTTEQNRNLILLPTNGSGLWIYTDSWQEIYSHHLTPAENQKIISALERMDQADPELRNNKSYGREIQERESEITYAALGKDAPNDLKVAWDPDFKKRLAMQSRLMKELPEFEVKIGGKTSIDITPKGMDKAYAIKKLMEHLKLEKKDILFFGDAVYENGNDFPVFQLGVDTIKVSGPADTQAHILSLLK